MPDTYCYSHARPSVTVDIVVFTVRDGALRVLLIRRGKEPFLGSWAIPGGHVELHESLEAAAYRELEEETRIPERACYLEQLYTFGAPDRDPRGRVIDVAYYALVRPEWTEITQAGDDAAEADWFPAERLPPLAFDHSEILHTAVQRLRGKIDYAPIAFSLVATAFTVAELRAVYEAIKGAEHDPANFRRRFKRMMEDGTIMATTGHRVGSRKPAALYRFRPAPVVDRCPTPA